MSDEQRLSDYHHKLIAEPGKLSKTERAALQSMSGKVPEPQQRMLDARLRRKGKRT